MKRIIWIGLIGLMALLLAGCGGGSQTAADSTAEAASALDTSREGAMSLRNQLALGTLRLEDTDQAVTAAQAEELLLLWQALRGTVGSGASAPAEVDALLEQIEGAMTAEQLAAINALQLTQADLQAWAQSQGLTMGTGSEQPGSGQNLSPEERATRQAERQASGATGAGTSQALIDAVIQVLESR